MILVMLTLMIAVSAEVYERMYRRSDLEWKFGRAKLIRGMIKTAPTPSPLNLFVKPFLYMKALIKFRKNMCLSMSQAAYNLMLIEEAAGVFDSEIDNESNALGPTLSNAFSPSSANFFPTDQTSPSGKFGRAVSRLRQLLGKHNDNQQQQQQQQQQRQMNERMYAANEDELFRGVSFYKRGHQHMQLTDVVNWPKVVERYREIRAEGADQEDAIIKELGVSLIEMEDWQLALWYEMEEMEDEEQKRERRSWLIDEFNSVIKT